MKYLWETIITTYNEYRGTGKGLTLFLVSVLIISFLRWNDRDAGKESRVHPLWFILSPLSGIGYAFTSLYFVSLRKTDRSLSERGKKGIGILTGLLIILVMMLSGGWVFSDADHYRTENSMHIKQAYVNVCDMLLNSEDGTIRVMASRDLSPYMKAYSSRFDLMYAFPKKSDASDLDDKARYVYDQMAYSTPDQGRIVKALREAGYDHIVYNTQKTYFEFPFEEYDYDLIGETDGYRIYRDRTLAAPALSAGLSDRIWPVLTIAGCLLFLAVSVIVFIRSGKKSEHVGERKENALPVLVTVLIICQIVGVILFSYDNPAALPAGIWSGRMFTLIYSVLPILMIPAYYYSYMTLAKRLFDEKEARWFLLLIICVLNLWGYQSDKALTATMLYCWFSLAAVVFHGFMPMLLSVLIDKHRERKDDPEYGVTGEESDYYKWEEEDMKNHKIINSRNLAIALIVVVILLIGSVYIMNRKINSLYETTVNLQQQVEELKK